MTHLTTLAAYFNFTCLVYCCCFFPPYTIIKIVLTEKYKVLSRREHLIVLCVYMVSKWAQNTRKYNMTILQIKASRSPPCLKPVYWNNHPEWKWNKHRRIYHIKLACNDHLWLYHTCITIRFSIFQVEKATEDWLVAMEANETFRVELLTNGRHNCLLVAIKHTKVYLIWQCSVKIWPTSAI